MRVSSCNNQTGSNWTAVGAGVGAALGAALGAATHALAEWLAVCVAIGALADAFLARRARACVSRDERPAR